MLITFCLFEIPFESNVSDKTSFVFVDTKRTLRRGWDSPVWGRGLPEASPFSPQRMPNCWHSPFFAYVVHCGEGGIPSPTSLRAEPPLLFRSGVFKNAKQFAFLKYPSNPMSQIKLLFVFVDTKRTLRRGWDSNPRSHQGETTDFESAPFDHSGTSPFFYFHHLNMPC